MKKPSAWLAGVAAVGLGGSAAVMVERRRFRRRLWGMERELGLEVIPAPPPELPAPVRELAQRLGAEDTRPPALVHLRQSGAFRSSPAAAEMTFVARTALATMRAGFVWHGKFAPFHFLEAAEYLTPHASGFEVRALGALPTASFAASVASRKAGLGRYLAQLPWVPGAILHNPHIEWSVHEDGSLQASAGTAADGRASVRLRLDAEGCIASAEMDDRPRWENGAAVEHRWRCRFADYTRIEGRLLPQNAEASWFDDSGEWLCWRGLLEQWSA